MPSKRPGKKTVEKKQRYNPEGVTFTILDIDRSTWNSLKERAKTDGRSVKWLMHDFISRYANGA